MSDDHEVSGDSTTRMSWRRNKLVAMIVMVIAIAGVLVSVGIVWYGIDGTAQLDLSRPEYEGVSPRLEAGVEAFKEYPANGPINAQALDEFERLFTTQSEDARSVDVFTGDPLSPAALGIDDLNQNRN